nr:ribonuclease H-like domain-containing protein [Tanacetum cinerariifolium]
MVTRTQVGTVKPNPRFHGHTSHISPIYPIPKSPSVALLDPNWRDVMYDKYNALIKNSTWVLVPKPPNFNVVRSIWLFRYKYHANGSLSRYKARLVANGRSQEFGVDCDDTFSHVVKSAIIWALNYFLGISVTRDSIGMFLSQKKYALELLDRAHMANCNLTQRPVNTKSKLGSDGDPISKPTIYRSLAGGLQYLTFTRPDISYVVQQVCLHMHDPREPHLAALKRVLLYVRGILDFGVQLFASITSSLIAYTGVDWAGYLTTSRFTSGYCVFLRDNLLSWSAKQQCAFSKSSVKVEYRGVANVVAETAWLRNLLRELHTSLLSVTLVYCDNFSAIYMTANHVQHQRTKHIEIDIHFVLDMFARGQVRVLHVSSRYQGFFEKQKITRPNFIDWYRQLRIVLSIEDKLNYLERPILPAPVAPASQQVAPEILAAHNAWIKGSKEIAGLMLMTMEPKIQRNLEPLHAHEMLKELKTLFAQQAEQEFLQTMRDFHSCRQEEGQSVSSYVLKMKGYINNLERLGHPVTLGLDTVNELHAMLKLHEQTMPKSTAPALNAIQAGKVQKGYKHKKSHSQTASKGQNHRKGKNKQAYAPKPKIPPPPKRENPAKDSICHECGEIGYWKRNYPQASRKLKPGALSLYVGNGQREAVEAIGAFYLCLPSGLETVLNNCHYAPSITRGVIYVSHLYEDGFVNHFVDNTIQVSKNNVVYFSAIPRDGIFEIDLSNSLTNESSIYVVSNKRAKLDLDSALLWHCQLGHISKKRNEKLQHNGLLDSSDLTAFKKCVSYISGKMARKPYTHQVERAKDLLGLIHTDVCGPFKIMSRQEASYFVTFINDFSRYGYVYLLKHKHEVFEIFKVFQKEVENQLGKNIKSLRSDRRGEYMSQEFLDHLKDHRIIAYRTPPYTPQHNGYPKETMGYSFYYPPENKVLVALNAEFLENSLIVQEASGSLEDLEIIQEEDTHPSLNTSLNHEEDDLEIDEHQSKWLFKKKTDMDGNVHIYKARLVAKGYTQTLRIDYEETFSPVADIRAIRILIDIVAYYDYEIWQMDVKTAFLNGYLNKEEKLKLSKSQGASTPVEMKRMQNVPYASTVGSIMYVVRCTRPDVAFAQNITSRFQQNPGDIHWTTVKNILKYLRNTKDMFLVYGGDLKRELKVFCYTDAGYLTNADDLKSQTGYVFILNGGAVDWKSAKQIIFATSFAEAEYIAAFDASKEAVWVRKFISRLGVVSTIEEPISMYCDNTGAIAISNESGIMKGARHFHAKVHYLREVIEFGDIKLEKVHTDDNLADPFTKALAFPKHFEHTRNIGMLSANRNYAKEVRPGGKEYEVLVKPFLEFHEINTNNDVNAYLFSSWCKFSWQNADFGWGKPVWKSMGKMETQNLVIMMDDQEGDGVEAWVHLDEKRMCQLEQDPDIQTYAYLVQ